ncbi:hypothetical protein J8E27_07890 [Brucella sp. 458]|uniref:hypothetical protein n=1 Tax=Brucella sp. 458 TaxID=2821140 RepID=UPI001ADEC297|nr:hypothetical protein [Brucella sp. 458]QTN98187.1 hypothetical protein J8E27_07890 [Brucella sp. 458]
MDFESIQGALGLATTAVSLTGKAASTASAIKKLLTSDKAPDKSEAETLLNNLATELTSANMTNVQLSEAVKALSQELKRQNEFENEKARYEFFGTPVGDYVFKLKEDMANGQPLHYLCPVCLNKDKIFSYLRDSGTLKKCQTDTNHHFRFAPAPKRQSIGEISARLNRGGSHW